MSRRARENVVATIYALICLTVVMLILLAFAYVVVPNAFGADTESLTTSPSAIGNSYVGAFHAGVRVLSISTSRRVTTAHVFAAATNTSATTMPAWLDSATLTMPTAKITWQPEHDAFVVTLDAQVRSDLDVATTWATAANTKGSYPVFVGDGRRVSYDWLIGNAAARRDWLDHANGEDPVVWFCKHGYDSPLATYTAFFTFNRSVSEQALSMATVQYNGVLYPATIAPADCFAGCRIYADVPCVHELTTTIVALRAPDDTRYRKCVWLRNGTGAGMQCPSGVAQ